LNSFSISELQQFSGIKAHTIRIWEQRYDALKPNRSEGNTRYYDGQQLRRLLNIVSLMHSDHKVSELCKMPDEKIYALLDKQLTQTKISDQTEDYFVSQIIAAALEYNEALFDKIFSHAILRFSVRGSYTKILYQALVRLGLMWSNDSLRPAHEHFITALFRQKLLTAIDALPLAASAKEVWMLFLPGNEFHETGLLFANFLIRKAGRKVIYLGADVPPESLEAAVSVVKPACLLTFLIRRNDIKNDEQLISYLASHFKHQKIYIACEPSRLGEIKSKRKVVALHTVADLEKVLE